MMGIFVAVTIENEKGDPDCNLDRLAAERVALRECCTA